MYKIEGEKALRPGKQENRSCRNMSYAYVSPYTNPVNQFSKIQIGDLRSLGYRTYPMSQAIKGGWLTPRRRKLLVLNWFEDRVASSRYPWIELGRSLATLAFLRLRVGTIVWFRHNEAPHADTRSMRVNRFFTAAIARLADTTVTLRPSPLGEYVVPHPDYPVQDVETARRISRADIYVAFGSIRGNRGFDKLLHWWPQGRTLEVFGKCDDAVLTRALRSIISERKLNVVWQNRFIPDNELDGVLSRSRYAIIMHQDGTSLVPGTFFHASSLGANVLVTPGDFARYAASTYSFVQPLTETTLASPQAYISPIDVLAELYALNGEDARRVAWRALLTKLDALPGKG
jgi:beta-1,4-mannosyltransferase